MKGVIYFIAAEGRGLVKIGWTRGWASQRLRQLQPACPDLLTILAEIEGRPGDERVLHARFAQHHFRGEWFFLRDSLALFIDALRARGTIGGLV